MTAFDTLDRAWLASRPGVKWRALPAGVLAAWVADMDFPTPPPVVEALLKRVEQGDLGYPDGHCDHPLQGGFAKRMAERFGWSVEPGEVRVFSDVVQAFQVCLHLATKPGDGVAIMCPSYPPLIGTLREMGLDLVVVPAVETAAGWHFDLDELEREADAGRCKVVVLVNPHNPTGRSLTVTELAEIGRVAERYDLLVIADEIHADLTYSPARHVPFASLSPGLQERTVTLYSATKPFNLGGICCAVAHLAPGWIRDRLSVLPSHLFGGVGVLSVTATEAAWSPSGDEWLSSLVSHLDGLRQVVVARVASDLPGVSVRLPEATYLAWLDCRGADLGPSPAKWFRTHAAVELSDGPSFGPGGEGFARLNFATSRAILDEIIDRMAEALARGGPAEVPAS